MQQQPGGVVHTPTAPGTEGAWGEYGRRIRFLGRVGLFQGASTTVLTHIATALRPLAVGAGTIVCREGEPGDAFFLIESGTLAVVADVGGAPRTLARLGPGEFFGELALLRQAGRRTATVRAESEAQLWSLGAADFQELLAQEPELAATVRRAAQIRETATAQGVFEIERRNLAALADSGRAIRIGRDADNDLVFPSRLISRHHAVVEPAGAGFRIRDLGSSNGTYVNGAQVRAAELTDGAEIWVGDERFVFDRRQIQRLVEPRGVRIDATNLGRTVKGGKQLLHDISLSILPGEFVAIVGGSGAGKSTLMDALSGVRPATAGRVLYNGRDYYREQALYRNVLGYVPQDDIIHTTLPVRSTLLHAAKLRLPPDTSKANLDAAVDGALTSLGLTNQANTFVGALSGGQRKRCSIGVELLTQPRIFFLDEPTSGLDPATDAQMMRLMRRMADEGSTVVLTTHATKNVVLCDKVVFLARGGYLAFVGTPQRALRYFETEAFDEIYNRLSDEATPEEWAQRFRASPDFAQVLAEQPTATGPAAAPATPHALGASGRAGIGQQIRQFFVLSGRNFDLIRRNPQNIPPLVMPAVVFTLLIIALFKSGIFNRGTDNPTTPTQVLFLLVYSIFIFGLLFGIQEIVKEVAIFRRERMVNLGVIPYVLSKATFLGPLLLVLTLLMLGVLRVFGRLPSDGPAVYAKLFITLGLTGLAGLALALFTSSFAPGPQQATDLISLWIIPQVLLSGALFSVPSMSALGRVLSNLSTARWSFEAVGEITDLNGLYSSASTPIGQSLLLQYGDSFTRNPLQNWAILGLFIVIPLSLACLILRGKR